MFAGPDIDTVFPVSNFISIGRNYNIYFDFRILILKQKPKKFLDFQDIINK